MSFNLATILRESAAAHPDKPLAHAGDRAVTYAQVDALSGRVATALRGLGLRPGDKVAVHLPNVPQFLLAYFGALKAGLVVVPLNPLLTATEIAYHLTDSDSRALITFELFTASAVDGAARAGGVATYVVSATGAPPPAGALPFDDLLAAQDTGLFHAGSAEDTAVLLYTSGTTGKPKGAELSHFQLYMNCTLAGSIFGARPDDVSVAVLPLFHVFGLSSVLNVAVRFGATLVLVPRFEPAAVLDAVEAHRCTLFLGVPTMFVALLHHPAEGRDLTSLRAALSGGASMPGEVIRAFEEKFPGVVVLEGYGLSETASTTTFNTSAQDRKVLSIGKPIWGVDTKVVDPDGTELPRGAAHVGEIVIRGHNVMKGYYKRPEDTAAALRDGWFHSGDLGYQDEDGYFFVVDRLKDLIIRGGYNVYPREVEEVLYEHPAVVEAAVIGKPDSRLGEEVIAYVTLEPGSTTTEQDLVEHCKQHLAAYKYPRGITFVDTLPKGPTGKILKRDLKP
ncbi:long-chain-fatty-acid--CoA ligase [Actinokineospora bangkokensis]|uniref:Long-chain-fatty-acid--CoA ligase n=1 Tax=Actinokineospora bangkokensis TaxID=1193682 RepID=A0A1Q9LJV0_9PSEU|nr:long-chain fatty acid--CoA ligase [Actinokineospora bangkokensis]OLR92259.1 long-chain-fatty-acid--CoA ligase [Actinokineospora bangkokensis]